MASSSLLKSLSPLNWNLMMSSCTIYSAKNKLLQLLLLLQTLIILLSQVYFFCNLVRQTKPGLPVFYVNFWHTFYSICSVTTIFFLFVYRRKILEIMERLDSLLTTEDHKRLYTFTLLTLVGKLVFIAVSKWPYITLQIWLHYSKTGIISYGYYLWIWISLHDWALISISVYLTVLRVIHLAEKRCIRGLMTMTRVASKRKSLSSVSARTVFNEVDGFIRLKDDAMKILSFFPFVCFSYMFVESVGSIIELQTTLSNKKIAYSYTVVGHLCGTVTHAFLISYMTSDFCSESEKELKELQLNIVNRGDAKEWNFVLNKMKEAQDYEYKAYGFYRINKQLLLTFCSSLISFTVLFVQLINSDQ